MSKHLYTQTKIYNVINLSLSRLKVESYLIIIPDILPDKCRKYGAKVSPGYDICLSCGTKFSELPPRKAARDMWYGESTRSRFFYECIGIIIVFIITMLVLVFGMLPGAM
ncbi:MAG: hypothetical protein HWN80_19495 [Candidatus Lokiarchaeota archaeon]|nr:hypothetical protein [Candidatus Lokiarchaeota archaeon]